MALAQLIDRILEYKVGAYEKFDDALPGEMDGLRLNIVLFGMAGAGKSALINSILRSLDLEEVAVIQTAGKEGTRILETCDLPSDVSFFDTAGFFELGKIEEGELFRILYGIERPGDALYRDKLSAGKAAKGGVGAHRFERPPIADQMHVVVWVIKANDVRFEQGQYRELINFVLDRLKNEIITIITVITFDDEVQKMKNPEQERQRLRKAAIEVTGSRRNNVFFVANSVSGQDYVYRERVLEMLEEALKCGERSIKMRQNKRKTQRSLSESQDSSLKFPVENTEPPDYPKSLP